MTSSGASDYPSRVENAAQTAPEDVLAGQAPVAESSLRRLAELIASSPHNLVSARDREELFERHIVECAALAPQLPASGRWLDLGTGGGLPGLVLALAHPTTRWTLLDATRKKADAVSGFISEMQVPNADVIAGRAEAVARLADHRGHYDGVVARAVAPLRVLAELARGFLRDGGLLVAMKGPAWQRELAEAGPALTALRLTSMHSTRLAVPDRESWIVTMRADGPPPPGFPRRDGIPRQQPL